MESGLTWYFANGSNMDAERLFDERLAPEGVPRGPRIAGRLDNWQLTFDKQAREPAGAGAGNIVPRDGAVVHGTLNLLPPEGFEVLDRFEGVRAGHYERRTLTVRRGDDGTPVQAIVYAALRTSPGLRPTRAYLGHLIAGQDLLPPDYVRWLRATRTVD